MSLTEGEDRRFIALFEKLKNLESVTKALPSNATTLQDVRIRFDAVME